MDPELLNLFAAAAKRQGGNSRVLSALNNPWAAFLSGAYSPPVGGAGAGGAKWQQYASSDMPVVHDIMGKIQQGVDNRWLSSYVESLPASGVDMAGFQTSDLKGLANDLYKEYNSGASGTGKQDAFSKAGIRNPTDLYTTADVPIPAALSSLIGSNAAAYGATDEAYQKAMGKYGNAKRASQKSRKDINKIADTIQEVGWLSSGGADAMNKLSEWVRQQSDLNEATLAGAFQQFKPKERYQSIPYETKMESIYGRLNRDGAKYKTESGAAEQARVAYGEKNAIQDERNRIAAVDEAYRKGVLRAYAEQGRTPAKDQMAQVLSFLAKTGK